MDGPFAGGDRGAPDTQSTEATTAKSTARSRWESSFNGDSTHAIPAPAHSYQNAERTLLFLLLHSNKGTGKSLLMPWKNQERIKARRFVSELFRRFVSSSAQVNQSACHDSTIGVSRRSGAWRRSLPKDAARHIGDRVDERGSLIKRFRLHHCELGRCDMASRTCVALWDELGPRHSRRQSTESHANASRSRQRSAGRCKYHRVPSLL